LLVLLHTMFLFLLEGRYSVLRKYIMSHVKRQDLTLLEIWQSHGSAIFLATSNLVLRQSLAFSSCIVGDTHQDANNDVVGNNGTAAIAQEGQRYACERYKFHVAC